MAETALGQGGSRFPETQWSRIMSARDVGKDGSRERLQELLRTYWRPIYATLRRFHGLSIEDAKDATQEFFATMLERDFLKGLSGEGGRFRAFLRAALTRFMVDAHRRRTAQKRGGPAAVVLDVDEMEALLIDPKAPAPAEIYDREWRRTVIEAALCGLRGTLTSEGKEVYFKVFMSQMDGFLNTLEKSTYRTVAGDLDITESDVRNYLHYARQMFRLEVLRVLRETAGSEEDLSAEVRDLFGTM